MPEQRHNTPQEAGPSVGQRVARGALGVVMLAGPLVGAGSETHTVQADVPVAVDTYQTQEVQDPGKTLVVGVGADGKVINRYQEDFQTDSEDAHDSEGQVATTLEDLLGEDGWSQVYDIQITGHASAEDDSNAPDAGVTAPDIAEDGKPDNTNLALQRALLATQPVVDAFAKHGIDVGAQVEKEAGQQPESILAGQDVTGVEDQWSTHDYTEAEQLATQFGYDTVNDMITRYNDDEAAAPDAVQEFLKPLLNDERGATITIKLRSGESHTVYVKDGGKKIVYDKLTKQVSEPKPTVNPTAGFLSEQPAVVKPWEKAPKDAAFRTGKRAPQGTGAKPLRFGGGVPFNPTPSNFSR